MAGIFWGVDLGLVVLSLVFPEEALTIIESRLEPRGKVEYKFNKFIQFIYLCCVVFPFSQGLRVDFRR